MEDHRGLFAARLEEDLDFAARSGDTALIGRLASCLRGAFLSRRRDHDSQLALTVLQRGPPLLYKLLCLVVCTHRELLKAARDHTADTSRTWSNTTAVFAAAAHYVVHQGALDNFEAFIKATKDQIFGAKTLVRPDTFEERGSGAGHSPIDDIFSLYGAQRVFRVVGEKRGLTSAESRNALYQISSLMLLKQFVNQRDGSDSDGDGKSRVTSLFPAINIRPGSSDTEERGLRDLLLDLFLGHRELTRDDHARLTRHVRDEHVPESVNQTYPIPLRHLLVLLASAMAVEKQAGPREFTKLHRAGARDHLALISRNLADWMDLSLEAATPDRRKAWDNKREDSVAGVATKNNDKSKPPVKSGPVNTSDVASGQSAAERVDPKITVNSFNKPPAVKHTALSAGAVSSGEAGEGKRLVKDRSSRSSENSETTCDKTPRDDARNHGDGLRAVVKPRLATTSNTAERPQQPPQPPHCIHDDYEDDDDLFPTLVIDFGEGKTDSDPVDKAMSEQGRRVREGEGETDSQEKRTHIAASGDTLGNTRKQRENETPPPLIRITESLAPFIRNAKTSPELITAEAPIPLAEAVRNVRNVNRDVPDVRIGGSDVPKVRVVSRVAPNVRSVRCDANPPPAGVTSDKGHGKRACNTSSDTDDCVKSADVSPPKRTKPSSASWEEEHISPLVGPISPTAPMSWGGGPLKGMAAMSGGQGMTLSDREARTWAGNISPSPGPAVGQMGKTNKPAMSAGNTRPIHSNGHDRSSLLNQHDRGRPGQMGHPNFPVNRYARGGMPVVNSGFRPGSGPHMLGKMPPSYHVATGKSTMNSVNPRPAPDDARMSRQSQSHYPQSAHQGNQVTHVQGYLPQYPQTHATYPRPPYNNNNNNNNNNTNSYPPAGAPGQGRGRQENTSRGQQFSNLPHNYDYNHQYNYNYLRNIQTFPDFHFPHPSTRQAGREDGNSVMNGYRGNSDRGDPGSGNLTGHGQVRSPDYRQNPRRDYLQGQQVNPQNANVYPHNQEVQIPAAYSQFPAYPGSGKDISRSNQHMGHFPVAQGQENYPPAVNHRTNPAHGVDPQANYPPQVNRPVPPSHGSSQTGRYASQGPSQRNTSQLNNIYNNLPTSHNQNNVRQGVCHFDNHLGWHLNHGQALVQGHVHGPGQGHRENVYQQQHRALESETMRIYASLNDGTKAARSRADPSALTSEPRTSPPTEMDTSVHDMLWMEAMLEDVNAQNEELEEALIRGAQANDIYQKSTHGTGRSLSATSPIGTSMSLTSRTGTSPIGTSMSPTSQTGTSRMGSSLSCTSPSGTTLSCASPIGTSITHTSLTGTVDENENHQNDDLHNSDTCVWESVTVYSDDEDEEMKDVKPARPKPALTTPVTEEEKHKPLAPIVIKPMSPCIRVIQPIPLDSTAASPASFSASPGSVKDSPASSVELIPGAEKSEPGTAATEGYWQLNFEDGDCMSVFLNQES